jgi:hypothetical protein
MTNILEFPIRTENGPAQGAAVAARRQADIVLFPGIRYERAAEAAPGSGPPPDVRSGRPSKRGRKKRA